MRLLSKKCKIEERMVDGQIDSSLVVVAVDSLVRVHHFGISVEMIPQFLAEGNGAELLSPGHIFPASCRVHSSERLWRIHADSVSPEDLVPVNRDDRFIETD